MLLRESSSDSVTLTIGSFYPLWPYLSRHDPPPWRRPPWLSRRNSWKPSGCSPQLRRRDRWHRLPSTRSYQWFSLWRILQSLGYWARLWYVSWPRYLALFPLGPQEAPAHPWHRRSFPSRGGRVRRLFSLGLSARRHHPSSLRGLYRRAPSAWRSTSSVRWPSPLWYVSSSLFHLWWGRIFWVRQAWIGPWTSRLSPRYVALPFSSCLW